MRFADLATGPDPQLPLEAFEARRGRLAARLGDDDLLVVATHPETTYSHDVENRFRPHNDFWYLTGFDEPGAVLLVDGSGGSELFLRDRDPQAEIWHGRRLGVDRVPEALGVDHARSLDDLGRVLRDRLPTVAGEVHAVTGHHPWVHRRLRRALGKAPEDGAGLVADLRVRKDADELRLLQQAADVGAAGHRALVEALPDATHEFQLEAAFTAAIRAAGSTGPGYAPIVGAGANAAVLHYTANRDAIRRGDLVLVDAGAEWGYYNSDITRTFPTAGWSDLQAALYDLVDRARAAAIDAVRPGARLAEVHATAADVLEEGLVEQGLLEEGGDVRRFFMHGTSHFLGLDVHDVGSYRDADGKSRRLEEGMVITVEPGLYFNPDFTECPPATSGLGIRLEDDVAVTADGARVLTAGLPTARDAWT
ncbi:MAG: aminopeptidase P N-terminal domain-containing protein [Thermoplasmatota archaeon]